MSTHDEPVTSRIRIPRKHTRSGTRGSVTAERVIVDRGREAAARSPAQMTRPPRDPERVHDASASTGRWVGECTRHQTRDTPTTGGWPAAELPIALGLLLLYPAPPGLLGGALVAERKATYVLGIVELLPPGVKGLLLTAMLAALASTLDTHLNWGVAYWTNDIYAASSRRAAAGRPKRRAHWCASRAARTCCCSRSPSR